MNWKTLPLVATLAGVLAGCSGDDDAGVDETDGATGDESSGEPSELDPRVASFAAARCAQSNECECSGVEALDACIETAEALWISRFAAADELGLAFDEACAQDNLASLATADCRWPSTVYAGEHLCDRYCSIFYGDRGLGAACESYDALTSNCGRGLMCSGGTCVEACQALSGLAIGSYCMTPDNGAFEDCEAGSYCDWQTSTCRAFSGIGDSCVDVACGPDLWCDWMTDKCVAAAGPGEDCDGLPCAEGLFCNYAGGSFPTCRSPALAGESCDNNSCIDGLVCSEQYVCVAPPPAGQRCLQGQCAEGALCDWDVQICRARPTVGQPCLFGECAEQLWCQQTMDDPQGTCTSAKEDYEPCTGHAQCLTRYCPAGYCEPRPGLDEECDSTLVCQAGLVCNGATCQPTDYRGPAACVYDGW